MIIKYYCSICGTQCSSEEECRKHEEHCPFSLVKGTRWFCRLEAWGDNGYWFAHSEDVWLQPHSADPNNDIYDVTELDGTDSDKVVRLFKPTVLSNICAVDRSLVIQMFTIGVTEEKKVVPLMLPFAREYLSALKQTIDILLPSTDEANYEKGKKE